MTLAAFHPGNVAQRSQSAPGNARMIHHHIHFAYGSAQRPALRTHESEAVHPFVVLVGGSDQ